MPPPRSMARFLTALLLASALLAVVQLSRAATPTTAEEFWRTALPDYELPDAVLWQLQPDTSSESTAEGITSAVDNTAEEQLSRQWPFYDPFMYSKGSASPKSSDHHAHMPAEERLSRQWPFYDPFIYSKGSASPKSSDHHAHMPSEEQLSRQWPFYDPFIYSKGSASPKSSGHHAHMPAEERLSRQWPFYDPFMYSKGSASPKFSDHHAHMPAEERFSRQWPFYDPFMYSKGSASQKSSGHHSHMPAAGDSRDKKSALFFHEDAVQVGHTLPFFFPAARRPTLGMLPRDAADSIPFSTSALPDILARLGVAPGSDEAADMEETLSMCEAPSLPGEPKFCATSLEALVEASKAALGTGDIRPVTSTLPRSGAPWQPYTIGAVRPVVGGEGSRLVGCHQVVYPYTVYRCHDTGLARLYMVDMEGSRGSVVTVAVICHVDTSQWDPEHISFKILGTKPGGPPVCHTMPYGHIVWAKKKNGDGRSSA